MRMTQETRPRSAVDPTIVRIYAPATARCCAQHSGGIDRIGVFAARDGIELCSLFDGGEQSLASRHTPAISGSFHHDLSARGRYWRLPKRARLAAH